MSWLMDRVESIFIEYVALPPHLRPRLLPSAPNLTNAHASATFTFV